MRSSLKKALADHKKYLKKLGLDRIKKKKKNETFIFESCDSGTFACDLENMFGGIIVGLIRSLMVFCFPTFFYFIYF